MVSQMSEVKLLKSFKGILPKKQLNIIVIGQVFCFTIREAFKNKLAKLIVLPSALKGTEGCRRHRRTI